MGITVLEPAEDFILVPNNRCEMEEEESRFIGALLAKYKPKKIVEIGVALGGTSVLLLKNTDNSQHVYGIDYSTTWYADSKLPVGQQIPLHCDHDEIARYTLITGKDPIDGLKEVGGEIDFCLMDTNHSLPGELLQFFSVYKYLRKGACLIMHDVGLNFHPRWNSGRIKRDMVATNLLFSTVGSHKKYIPNSDWINIAALEIDDQTEENLESTCMALGISWAYYPGHLLDKYMEHIETNYSPVCAKFFRSCVKNQKLLVDVK